MKASSKQSRITKAEWWLLGEYDLFLEGTHPIAIARFALIGLLENAGAGLSREQIEQSTELIGQMERCGGHQQVKINAYRFEGLGDKLRADALKEIRKPKSRAKRKADK